MLTGCAAHLQRYRNKATTSLGILTGELRRQVEERGKPGFPIVPAYGRRNPGSEQNWQNVQVLLLLSWIHPCSEPVEA